MMAIMHFCNRSIFQVFLFLCQEFTKTTWWACFFKKKKKKKLFIESYQLLSLRLKVTMISPSTTSDCLSVYRGWLQLSPIVYHIYSPQCLWGLETWSQDFRLCWYSHRKEKVYSLRFYISRHNKNHLVLQIR